MSEQGTNHANRILDEERKHEAQPIVQGHGPSHVEEWRQVVSYPDDTDSPEVEAASGIDGTLRPASDEVAAGAAPEADSIRDRHVSLTEDQGRSGRSYSATERS